MTGPRVLVVCHANVARSVAAARLLRGAVDERGEPVELRTAGTHAPVGQAVSARTVRALSAVLDGAEDVTAHRSRQLVPADVAWADLIVAMEAAQVRQLRREHPDAAPRTATVAHLAEHLPDDDRPFLERLASMRLEEVELDGAGDVADPAGGDDAEYAGAVADLARRCGELARRLAG